MQGTLSVGLQSCSPCMQAPFPSQRPKTSWRDPVLLSLVMSFAGAPGCHIIIGRGWRLRTLRIIYLNAVLQCNHWLYDSHYRDMPWLTITSGTASLTLSLSVSLHASGALNIISLCKMYLKNSSMSQDVVHTKRNKSIIKNKSKQESTVTYSHLLMKKKKILLVPPNCSLLSYWITVGFLLYSCLNQIVRCVALMPLPFSSTQFLCTFQHLKPFNYFLNCYYAWFSCT